LVNKNHLKALSNFKLLDKVVKILIAQIRLIVTPFFKFVFPFRICARVDIVFFKRSPIANAQTVIAYIKRNTHCALIISIVIIYSSCSLNEKKTIQAKNDSTYLNSIDTIPIKTQEIDPYDSLAKAHVDTTTLKGKREWIMNHFLIENQPSSPDFDTLFDLTYDGYNDYIIGYYGQVGSGVKNRVKVYLYDTKKACYILNEQLSRLPNPTFYMKQKKITGFYIANGGGSGSRLEWHNRKWAITKEFYVHNEGDTTKWEISYPLKKKKEILVQPYQMVPPENILETKVSMY
jgi:hypothetical protein